ncbi:hypothetical protein JOC75_000552 [Metabacillus crassostreae]|uniref:hypothetical protein n=1 Tax=Metabacillus crassostreae TaxID=929098 RepID=UPI001957A6E2|nr:hypothetical protein [Metabacillus crassostreae]MBM7602582.1 hypothetical protein [Metabacillus crassostreae]
MWNKIKFVLFLIGAISIIVGMPYLLGKSTNEILRYPLYIGLIMFTAFFPARQITRMITKSN